MNTDATNDTKKGIPDRAQSAEPRLREDEVSLRELYLIFKRGLPWILGAALLAGALMFALTLRRAPVFEASSTVLVSPLPVENDGAEEAQSLTLSWGGAVPFEVYTTLAKSQEVLDAAVSRTLDPSGTEMRGAEVSAAQLKTEGRISERTRRNTAAENTPLVFEHVVSHANPEVAAALTNAWAMSTVDAVYRVRSANLAEVEEATRVEAAQLEQTLQSAETQWQDFQAQHRGTLEAARSEGLTTELVGGEADLRGLSRDIDASRARLETLRAQRQTRTPSSAADVQSEEIALSGLLAERESLEAQLQQIEAALGEQPAPALGAQERQLTRALERAEIAFEAVTDAQIRTAYLREIVPTTAQLLDRAPVPGAPLSEPRVSRIILAAFAGALLATLFVFLRAAVAPGTSKTSAQSLTQTPQPANS